MKIAILACTDFSIVGGGERFTYDVARALDATIISFGKESKLDRTHKCDDIKFKFLNKTLPKEPFKNLYGKWFYSHLKLDEEYDFYICMDDMSMHFVKDKPHMYLMFTPNRAMYDMNSWAIADKKGIMKFVYFVGLTVFREYDKYYVKKHIKNIVAISHTVRNRIFKAYLMDSEVIYPPVHVGKYHYESHAGYWLSVNRVDKWKRVHLQVEAFRKMPDKKLIIAGKIYPDQQYIVDNAPSNVTFLDVVNEDKLIELYSKCIGFITTAIDEDYGLTPIEAMASGKPVVATKEGGYLETVIDGHTGILVSPNAEEIVNAIHDIENKAKYYDYIDACIKQANNFDISVMSKKIKEIVRSCV